MYLKSFRDVVVRLPIFFRRTMFFSPFFHGNHDVVKTSFFLPLRTYHRNFFSFLRNARKRVEAESMR